jgi:hypothetical protein
MQYRNNILTMLDGTVAENVLHDAEGSSVDNTQSVCKTDKRRRDKERSLPSQEQA